MPADAKVLMIPARTDHHIRARAAVVGGAAGDAALTDRRPWIRCAVERRKE
jgi:hypothetical protein